MKISSALEFVDFLQRTNLKNVHHKFTDMTNLVVKISILGNCCGEELEKATLSRQLEEIYEDVVSSVVSRYKPHMFQHTKDQTISFYKYGSIHLKTISR